MITTNAVRRRQAKADAKAARRHPMKPTPIPAHHHVLVPLTAAREGKATPDLLVGWACVTCPEVLTPRYTPSKLRPSEGDLETGTQRRRRIRAMHRALELGRFKQVEEKEPEDETAIGVQVAHRRSQIHLRRVHSRAEMWSGSNLMDHLIAQGRIRTNA